MSLLRRFFRVSQRGELLQSLLVLSPFITDTMPFMKGEIHPYLEHAWFTDEVESRGCAVTEEKGREDCCEVRSDRGVLWPSNRTRQALAFVKGVT